MTARTDLAEEAEGLWEGPVGRFPGVRCRKWQERGLERTLVEILDDRGEAALGKPAGRYESLWLPEDSRTEEALETELGEVLGRFLSLGPTDSVLVVGLGNETLTPDALGPETVQKLLMTRHLLREAPAIFSDVRAVSGLVPGVLGQTGLESAEVVGAVVKAVRPDRVLVIDALAAAERKRLCRVVQITDAGIVPGSGVKNSRTAFSARTFGVPVVALGVPTVLDAGPDGFLTVRDIDSRIRRLSRGISGGIHKALFPHWKAQEIAQLGFE